MPASGVNALFSNTTGNLNVALGINSMLRNTTVALTSL